METKYYGVQQSHYGHWYRWIFDEATLKNDLGDILSGECIYPMGGSNSSIAWIEELKTDEEVREFLTRPDEPDSDDPTLVDLGEYLLTVDIDFGSCTQMWLDKLGLVATNLTQIDDRYGRCADVETKARELKEMGITGFDYDNPFYGANKDMRYSEFIEFYNNENNI